MRKTSLKNLSKIAKILTIGSSLGGVALAVLTASASGYTHWASRLLYFTAQSNIWMGLTAFVLLCFPRNKTAFQMGKGWKTAYALKYVFTVSITLTGLVFCGLLAPFCGDEYKPWTTANFLTHVFAPAFAVLDFFLDENQPFVSKKQTLCCLIPPLLYSVLASTLCYFGVDFGRGKTYPYFFLNYRSPAGIFGFSRERPFFMGEFYWLVLLGLLVWGIAWLYARLYNAIWRKGAFKGEKRR